MKLQLPIMAILATINSVLSVPIVTERQYSITDIQILNYALTLEHLEDSFYHEGLLNYTQAEFIEAGFPDPFYANLQEIANDEKTHVSYLTAALGSAATAECTYDFPATTPSDFVALASVLEGVGVSAYLGAAASILDKTYLTDAASILTIEARHSAYLRAALHESPFPAPFDTPLSFNQVYTLAAPLIVSCPPSNPSLPVKAFPTLELPPGSGIVTPGSTITLLTPGTQLEPNGGKGLIYSAFITAMGPVFGVATLVPGGVRVVVPAQGVAGQAYVVITGCDQFVNDATVVAGPAIVEVAA